MKKVCSLFVASLLCCLIFSGVIIFSCSEPQEIVSDPSQSIQYRSGEGLWPDSIFQLHNSYILWMFDNHLDSAIYYTSDPVDFMQFASRKWFQFTHVQADAEIMDWVIDGDDLVLSKPYYTYNEGFTNESLYDAHWSSLDLGYINTVLDSVIEAVEDE